MEMEIHKCKLCSRVFSNGRALGGHMRSHLAILPLPTKQLGDHTESNSSSSSHSDHPNPDPELLDAGSVVQDRESETESTQNPTRKRSKRASHQRKTPCGSHRVKTESVTESAPLSSVTDSSQDEEVALCLMMMSRDVWERGLDNSNSVEYTNDSSELKLTRRVTRFVPRIKSLSCKKKTRATNRGVEVNHGEDKKIYECPFCEKIFGSGQALGGHKRSHLLGSSSTNNTKEITSNKENNNVCYVGDDKVGDTSSFILDLNLPAPLDDDDDGGGEDIIYHSQL